MLTGFLDSGQYTYVNLELEVTSTMSVTFMVTPMDATNDTSDIHIYGAFESCPTPNSHLWLTVTFFLILGNVFSHIGMPKALL